MDKSKRKERQSSSSSTSSPLDKRQKPNDDESFSSEENEIDQALNMAADIAANLKLIFQKLEKLDSLEFLINKTLNKVEAVEIQVNDLTLTVESLECKNRVTDKAIGELTASVEFTSNSYDNLKSVQTKDRDVSNAAIARLNKEISYLEAYSRRENLLFEGIREVPDEDNDGLEDTAAVLHTFMASTLKVENAEAIEFQRVHRLGRRKSNAPRVIIARFLRYGDRQRIAKLGRILKDDKIRIYPDYPKLIQEARRRQIPKLKEAKQAGRTAYFSQSKPDLLYVDGRPVPE